MKKTVIGILTAIILIVLLAVWQGDAIMDMIFYDMDATMDLPDNLYDDESLTDASGSGQDNLYLVNVNDFLSLRENPKSGSTVLAKLDPGTEVEIVADADDPFVEVYVPSLDQAGYVHEDYLVKK